jgi:hypothetical protein
LIHLNCTKVSSIEFSNPTKFNNVRCGSRQTSKLDSIEIRLLEPRYCDGSEPGGTQVLPKQSDRLQRAAPQKRRRSRLRGFVRSTNRSQN